MSETKSEQENWGSPGSYVSLGVIAVCFIAIISSISVSNYETTQSKQVAEVRAQELHDRNVELQYRREAVKEGQVLQAKAEAEEKYQADYKAMSEELATTTAEFVSPNAGSACISNVWQVPANLLKEVNDEFVGAPAGDFAVWVPVVKPRDLSDADVKADLTLYLAAHPELKPEVRDTCSTK
jgi:hypothetical protein